MPDEPLLGAHQRAVAALPRRHEFEPESPAQMTSTEHQDTPPPPESWDPARRLARRVAEPVERFMHVAASSGIVLLFTALIALAWANSPWAASYEQLWHTPIGIGIGAWSFERDLHFWINDFLMAIFFLVVGLEIKRELVEGALSELRRAALPVAAALGGMLVPALIFFAFNPSGPGQSGWGVPMATDIAFAVGIVTLLGTRIPATLRVLLLALAIIDDLGAILVIALFYSTGIQLGALLWVALGVLTLLAVHRAGIRPGIAYVLPGILLWSGMLQFGVHPTIAGVIVGLMTPVKPWYGEQGFLRAARKAIDDFQSRISRQDHSESDLLEPLGRLARARREAISPAKRLEAALHPWVAFGIMPVFALANAGVSLSGVQLTDTTSFNVFAGVVVGLVVGKPLGIVGLSWISVRLGLCMLPPGVSWGGMYVVGAAGGIGFTMAIFIGELAFADTLLAAGKLGVLVGTAAASALALGAGLSISSRKGPRKTQAIRLSDVEGSAEYWTTEGGT